MSGFLAACPNEHERGRVGAESNLARAVVAVVPVVAAIVAPVAAPVVTCIAAWLRSTPAPRIAVIAGHISARLDGTWGVNHAHFGGTFE